MKACKILSVFLLCIAIFSVGGCSKNDSEASTQTHTEQSTRKSDMCEEPVLNDEASSKSENFIEERNKTVYDFKDNIEYHKGKVPFDESLFWNYSDENDGSRGFIIPSERMSNNYELYVKAAELINNKLNFEAVLSGDATNGFAVEDESLLIADEFYPASVDTYFGCESVAELKEYYCTIYAGNTDFSIFDKFKDVDGRLYVKYLGLSAGLLNGMEWSSEAKFIIYDETTEFAHLIVSVPHYSTNAAGEYYNYSFYGMDLINTENGWRLSDDTLWYY